MGICALLVGEPGELSRLKCLFLAWRASSVASAALGLYKKRTNTRIIGAREPKKSDADSTTE